MNESAVNRRTWVFASRQASASKPAFRVQHLERNSTADQPFSTATRGKKQPERSPRRTTMPCTPRDSDAGFRAGSGSLSTDSSISKACSSAAVIGLCPNRGSEREDCVTSAMVAGRSVVGENVPVQPRKSLPDQKVTNTPPKRPLRRGTGENEPTARRSSTCRATARAWLSRFRRCSGETLTGLSRTGGAFIWVAAPRRRPWAPHRRSLFRCKLHESIHAGGHGPIASPRQAQRPGPGCAAPPLGTSFPQPALAWAAAESRRHSSNFPGAGTSSKKIRRGLETHGGDLTTYTIERLARRAKASPGWRRAEATSWPRRR